MKCEFEFEELVAAYYDCRKNKRRTDSAITFELHLEQNLWQLYQELTSGEYQIGRSVCFVVEKPRVREIWSAEFRDRIVHHLVYNRLSPKWNRLFVADSCACIPGRGTKYGAERLHKHIRSYTENWKHDYFYLKCDLSNFFVSINKDILWELILKEMGSHPEWLIHLTELILYNDPTINALFNSPKELMERVPPNKRLLLAQKNRGLPIGNLTSQFFANILLDALDKFIKHILKVEKYVRYVDDFIILGKSSRELSDIYRKIKEKVLELGLMLNPKKCFIHKISRGVSFVGQTIYPFRRVPLSNTVRKCLNKLETSPTSLQPFIAYISQAQKSHNLVNKFREALNEIHPIHIR